MAGRWIWLQLGCFVVSIIPAGCMEDFSLPPSIKELLANPTPHHKGHPGIKPRACEFQINSKCRFAKDFVAGSKQKLCGCVLYRGGHWLVGLGRSFQWAELMQFKLGWYSKRYVMRIWERQFCQNQTFRRILPSNRERKREPSVGKKSSWQVLREREIKLWTVQEAIIIMDSNWRPW